MRILIALLVSATACTSSPVQLLDAGGAEPKSLCNVFCTSSSFCGNDLTGRCRFCNHNECGPVPLDPEPPPVPEATTPALRVILEAAPTPEPRTSLTQ